MAVLQVNNVSKSFEQEKIIENISLELHEGELVSLLGVSGGGKTTLFNIIAGLSSPDEGNVILDGADITGKPGNISYMLQKDLLLSHLQWSLSDCVLHRNNWYVHANQYSVPFLSIFSKFECYPHQLVQFPFLRKNKEIIYRPHF